MGFLDKRTFSVLVTVGLFAGVIALIWLARRPVIAFLFAIFFAYLLLPLAARIHAMIKGSWMLSIAVTYAVIIAALVVFFFFLGPHIARDARKLIQTLPDLFQKVSSGQIAFQLGGQHGWSYETQKRLQDFLTSHRDAILNGVQQIGVRAAALLSNIAWLVLIPILALFFLKDKSDFGAAFLDMIDSRRERHFLRSVMNDLDRMLAVYIRAQLLLAFFAAIAYTVFLLLMRFPYGFVLGAVAGMLEFIPFVGPLITAALLIGIAFLTGYKHLVILVIFLAVWRLLQDYVNSPHLMGTGLELHPLAVIFGILVGGEIGGVVGIFLSVPIIAAVRILWRNMETFEETKKSSVDNASPLTQQHKSA